MSQKFIDAQGRCPKCKQARGLVCTSQHWPKKDKYQWQMVTSKYKCRLCGFTWAEKHRTRRSRESEAAYRDLFKGGSR